MSVIRFMEMDTEHFYDWKLEIQQFNSGKNTEHDLISFKKIEWRKFFFIGWVLTKFIQMFWLKYTQG